MDTDDPERHLADNWPLARQQTASRKQARFDSQVAFHEKMAVLSAGSIGVALSLIGAAFSSKQAAFFVPPLSRWLVLLSLALVFLSLVLSVVHNFCMSRSISREIYLSELEEQQTLLLRGFWYRSPSTISAVHAKQEEWNRENERLQSYRQKVSNAGFTGVFCFVFGYLAVILWITAALFSKAR